MIDAMNCPIADHLCQDVVFCAFYVQFQDDVIKPPRSASEPTGKIDGSHLDRVLRIKGPEATGMTSQLVLKESASIAVLAVEKEILKTFSVVH